jgi:hypothetical protein
MTNPDASVVAPAAQANRGFDWTAVGTLDARGNREIMINFKYKNPLINRYENASMRVPFQPGNVESIQNALNEIAEKYAHYRMIREKYEQSLQK